ncbi:MAG: gfo/Idh/MocA family oxidoreductase [Chitinivibrionales bacterium]|nr:gfo/Idh/MocA family oxidoreductase [Chitinivibrionales bacterium]
MIQVGVIGYGYWGPNIVRNFRQTDGLQVVAICDRDRSTHQRIQRENPGVEVTNDCDSIIKSPRIDAIAIVTPVSTHYDLALSALRQGKHVFVEKPMTQTSAQARELGDVALAKGLTVMVDHTFLFTGAVRKIKELMTERVLGDIYYYDSTRVNLGLFQHDVNVIWDLAPHDFSIMYHLIDDKPTSVVACGRSHVNGMEDVAYVTVGFSHGRTLAHFNVNWLSPVKVRTTLIGGKKKMLVWDDLSADEKVRVYDRGVNVTTREGIYKLLVAYRSGDMHAPRIDHQEALRLESQYFVECIDKKHLPINGAEAGYEVVRMLEACDESLRNDGRQVKL